MKQHHGAFALRHRSVCWLISLAIAAFLVLLISQGAMGFGIFATAIIWPGGILGLMVVMPIGLLGALPWIEDLLGLEAPAIYMLVSLLMGIVFWWALALTLLLWRRRKLLAAEATTI
jgi:hypothetical protein